jgi:hypothetical protein
LPAPGPMPTGRGNLFVSLMNTRRRTSADHEPARWNIVPGAENPVGVVAAIETTGSPRDGWGDMQTARGRHARRVPRSWRRSTCAGIRPRATQPARGTRDADAARARLPAAEGKPAPGARGANAAAKTRFEELGVRSAQLGRGDVRVQSSTSAAEAATPGVRRPTAGEWVRPVIGDLVLLACYLSRTTAIDFTVFPALSRTK